MKGGKKDNREPPLNQKRGTDQQGSGQGKRRVETKQGSGGRGKTKVNTPIMEPEELRIKVKEGIWGYGRRM